MINIVTYTLLLNDPCELCDVGKPCLSGNKYGGYSCSDFSELGLCGVNTRLCIDKILRGKQKSRIIHSTLKSIKEEA